MNDLETIKAKLTGETFRLRDGYVLNRGLTGTYRYMTAGEMAALRYGERVCFIDNEHKVVREATVNGRPRTWKRAPGRVRVPLKYGMREYAYAEISVLRHGTPLVVRISD